jgi:Protein of unknown function (DUF1553)/Protein of unknown function (DUF1549)/Planctomycete cytochrome C
MQRLSPFLLLVFPLAAPAGDRLEFNRDIRPILSDACFQCHGPDKSKRKADLRLDSAAGNKVVVSGKPAESELIRRITSADKDEVMPPPSSGRLLTAAQRDVLKKWVEQGAEWQTHWAYVVPKRPDIPPVKDSVWGKNPIDRFVLARLEREGLKPSSEALKHTLIRRLSLDLTGLPPTPTEVDAFVNEASPDAYEKLVARLLGSRRFGERLAYDWLDAARYADSNGYQEDLTRTLWPWRDWVVGAFNANKPFDQFTVEQIAGDLLPGATTEQKIATGFHRNHMLNGEGGRVAEESRIDYVVDRVDTTAQVWLGLTLGCARCHDHKFDPFSQKEYYRLFAYFNSIAESGAVDRRGPDERGNANPVLRVPSKEQERALFDSTRTIRELDPVVKKTAPRPTASDVHRAAIVGLFRTPTVSISEAIVRPSPAFGDAKRAVTKAKKVLDDTNKVVVEVMVMEDLPSARDTFVLNRGAWDQHGEKVSAGVPELLGKLRLGMPPNRFALAKWLVSPDNPLTARVIVNRYWQLLFGVGIVRTTEDFGVQGEPPVHPELLDWLAVEFRDSGWDLKKLLTLIVTSSAYRQSSKVTPELQERDPANRLLARSSRYRLSSHAIRDQALVASGLMVERAGGPPVKPYQPPNIWEEFSFNHIHYKQDHGGDLYRRSLYTYWRRTVAPPDLFDTPARQVCVVRPSRTNTPLHALITLNDVTFVESYRVLAERLMREGGLTPADRIAYAFRLTVSRDPTAKERQVLLSAFQRLLEQYVADRKAAEQMVGQGEHTRDAKLDVAELAAYASVASVILNLDEALTRE